MKTLLLNVSYIDNTDQFWVDSLIKNKTIKFDPDNENIHVIIKTLCKEQDYMELTYNGKPQGNVYSDIFDDNNELIGNKTIGYMYRGKCEIHERDMIKSKTGFFDVWVTIFEIIQFDIENLEN